MFERFRFHTLTGHLTDEDIIRESDGELAFVPARRTRRHLKTCWSCRSRKQELDGGMAAFAQLYRRRFDTPIPLSDQPGKLLEARLAGKSQGQRSRLQSLNSLRWIAVSAMAVLLISGVALFSRRVRGTQPGLPDSALSPGVWTAVSRGHVCQMQSEDGGIIDNALVRQVFSRYRVEQPLPGAYEIDFVIPPALGGVMTAGNLWPQPYNSGSWNSHAKDALEDKLESLVCSGQLDLRDAQAALAENWIAAYKNYFNSHQPLIGHIAFFKDRPWPFARPIKQ